MGIRFIGAKVNPLPFRWNIRDTGASRINVSRSFFEFYSTTIHRYANMIEQVWNKDPDNTSVHVHCEVAVRVALSFIFFLDCYDQSYAILEFVKREKEREKEKVRRSVVSDENLSKEKRISTSTFPPTFTCTRSPVRSLPRIGTRFPCWAEFSSPPFR